MPPQYTLGHSHAGNGAPYGAGCVLGIREQPHLVDELGRCRWSSPRRSGASGSSATGWSNVNGDLFADDGGDLEEAFVLLSKPVDARCQHHLDGGRSWIAWAGCI